MLDFSLYDTHNNLFKLSDNLPIVLYFYPKDATKDCTLEALDFSKYIDEFHKLGYKVFGISKDNIQSHLNFTNKFELKINLLSDLEGRVSKLFGVIKEKQMYGKKYLGIERSTFIISTESKIIKEWRNVKVAGHVLAVLEYLKSIKT